MRFSPHDERHYAAPEIAILIDAGYVTGFPHEWTRDGSRAIRRAANGSRTYDGTKVLREALSGMMRVRKSLFQSHQIGGYYLCSNVMDGDDFA